MRQFLGLSMRTEYRLQIGRKCVAVARVVHEYSIEIAQEKKCDAVSRVVHEYSIEVAR